MIFDPGTMTTIQMVPEGGLEKGQQALLTVIDPTLRRAVVTAGWQAPSKHDGFDVDVDLSAFMLRIDGFVRKDTDFVFYNNAEAESQAIIYKETIVDDGSGDREAFEISFEALPYEVEKISFVLSIHNADERQQYFNLVKHMYLRVVNPETGAELIRYNLKEDLSESNVIIFGELLRDGMGWNFHAIGEGAKDGLYQVARDYHVNVAPI